MGRALVRLRDQARAILGMRRSFTVEGVKYTERSGETLRRSLSRKGPGRKEYEAVFPDGTSMRLRCTVSRVYADIGGARLLPIYRLVEPMVRPGMRVLDLACTTGYGAAYLGELVGPSGAVVALDRDRESIRFAQARYKTGTIAFEVGFIETLAGEVDGAFEGIMACEALTAADNPGAVIAELWRTLAPGGWLLLVAPRATGGAGAGEQVSAFSKEDLGRLATVACKSSEDDAQGESGPRPPPVEAEIAPTTVQDHTTVLVRRPVR